MGKFFHGRCGEFFFIIACLIFSISYINNSQISGPGTTAPEVATFMHSAWPWKGRFLLPWIFHLFFSDTTLNGLTFRITLAFLSSFCSVLILPCFARRLCATEAAVQYSKFSFIIILLVHFCTVGPSIYNPYYIYDIPECLFVMIVFLFLTSVNVSKNLIGVCLTFIFYLNKESISAALFFAIGWWIAYCKQNNYSVKAVAVPMAIIIVALIGTFFERQIVYSILNGDRTANIIDMFYVNGRPRFINELELLIASPGYFKQFISVGFGAVLYLPFVIKNQSLSVKLVILMSIIPLVPLLLFANFITEIRVWNEYIPLFACLLASLFGWSMPSKLENRLGKID
jgi:hypothetical protein